MNKVWRITKREYIATVKTKGFIIGLVVAPLLMSGSIVAMALFSGKVDTEDKRIAVIDHTGKTAAHISEMAEARNSTVVYDEAKGKKVKPAYLIETISTLGEDPTTLRVQLSDRVRSGELHAFLEIDSGVLNLGTGEIPAKMIYYAENAALDDIRGWLRDLTNEFLRVERLNQLGVEDTDARVALTWIEMEPRGLITLDEETGEADDPGRTSELETLLVPMFAMLLLFLMLMMGASPMITTVMEEKTLRIAEVILGSVRPFEFMMGKILGGICVSLTAFTVYMGLGAIAAVYYGYEEKVPVEILPWFAAYMVLMLFMVGAGMAALGAASNDAKDAQNLTFPAIMPLMIPMFLMVPILQAPNSGFATWLSLFPPFTPMLMMLRLASPVTVPAWQPWAGLLGVLVFALFSVWVAGRVFRVAIMLHGQPPNLGLLIKWALKG